MPNINSVKFDVSDCTLREQSEEHLGWCAENGVYLVLRVPKVRMNWSFDLQDIVVAREFFSRQCTQNGGVLLAMENVKVLGHTALRGLFKYRSPIPQSLGMMFVNILWISLGDWSTQINVESLEQGETGVREAAVCVMEGESPAGSAPSEPVLVNSVDLCLVGPAKSITAKQRLSCTASCDLSGCYPLLTPLCQSGLYLGCLSEPG